jgi:uncharacterized protein GlcG (DUF336 family)
MWTAGPASSFAFAAVVSLTALPSLGADAPARINAEAASQIIEGCAAHAKGKGQSHAIAVYDDGGALVAMLRMDGNTPGVTEFALAKGAAVAHWRFSTARMLEASKETPGFANAPHIVTVPGGVPVFSSDAKQYLGAVGVSGEAPEDDVACAEAGIRAAGFSPTRKPSN